MLIKVSNEHIWTHSSNIFDNHNKIKHILEKEVIQIVPICLEMFMDIVQNMLNRRCFDSCV